MTPSNTHSANSETLNHNEISSYTVPWLPYSKAAIEMAFPHLQVKKEEVPEYGDGSLDVVEPGFALYAEGEELPVFCITEDSDSGYCYSVTAHNSQALCLGRYRVGETHFKDFQDEWSDDADFMIDGDKILVLSDCEDYGGIFDSRFIFSPPSNFKGNLKKVTSDIWAECIMSEARFYISGRSVRPLREATEKEGLALLKKETLHGMPVEMKPGQNLDDGYGLKMLMRLQYSSTKAKNAYIKLVDLAIHNAPIESTKETIKKIFKKSDDPQSALLQISEIFHQDYETVFLFNLDWKDELIELENNIKFALGDNFGDVKLPELNNFETDMIVSSDGVFNAYAKTLNNAGLDLWLMEGETDAYILFISQIENRKKIDVLLKPTHIEARPILAE